MNANDRRVWIDLMAARYLEAVEVEDFETQERLWEAAADDPQLEDAFHEMHRLLLNEREELLKGAIADAVEKHLPSAAIVRDPAGPVTFADVADELFRNPPAGLSNDAFRLNDELRSSVEPLPTELGLSALIAFAETKFGAAPREYWRAFKLAALEVRMRANSRAADYQLAARREPRPEDRP